MADKPFTMKQSGRLYQNPGTIQDADFDLTATNLPVAIRNDPTYSTYRKYIDGTTQGRTLMTGIIRSAATALTTNTPVNIGTIIIPARSSWMISAMGGYTLAATTTATNFALSVSKTSATLSGADTVGFPTDGEVRYQYDGTGTILTGGGFTALIPSYRYDNETNGSVTLYLVLRCLFGVSTVSGYGSFTGISVL